MAEAPTRLLSARQTEIARLVSSGKSNREIASALFISERTVETHITAIYTKLEVRSRTELTVAMLRSDPDDVRRPSTHASVPLATKSLVGREKDCVRIDGALDAHALVTITGPGGIGKTRAALEIGRDRSARMSGGACFVDLAPLSDAGSVVATIAHALGVSESRDAASLTNLISFLRAKHLLLILDNCEHVVAEAARVADGILQACPHVRILATSREPLRVAGEGVSRLPPLRSTDAVALFAQRAISRNDRFVLDDETRPFVTDICARLDGIPLAIELAAARVGMLSVREIAASLDRRLSLLSNGERNALPRHKTIRALLDWSYDLLDASERRLFAHLAIFAGGCTLAAARAVCPQSDRAQDDDVQLLSSLVDKSLVVVNAEQHESRYKMLESSRIYARDKLVERGEAHEAARRHALFYTGLAEAHERSYASDSEPAWRERSESELENWRAALRWSFGPQGDVVLGQRLAGALGPVWRHFAYAEGRAWVNAAYERRPSAIEVTARLSLARAAIALGFVDYETASQSAQVALSFYREIGDPLRIAHAQYVVGHSRILQGDVGASVANVYEALETARRHGDVRLTGLALESLAVARLLSGDPAGARIFFRDALAVFDALRARRNATLVSFNLAETEFQAGDARAALSLTLTALPAARRFDPHFTVAALSNIAAYFVALDRYDEARSHALEAFGLAHGLQLDVFIVWTLQRLAAIAALHRGRFDSAARLLAYIDARVTQLDAVRHHTEQQEYDRITVALSRALDTEALDALRTSGASMDEECAVSEAFAGSL